MRRKSLIASIATVALLWMGRNLPASAATFTCQGQTTTTLVYYGPTVVSNNNLAAKFRPTTVGNQTLTFSAIWTLSSKPSGKFSSGSLTIPVPDGPCACLYSLATPVSSYYTLNGFIEQEVIWEQTNSCMDCPPEFQDYIDFSSNSSGSGIFSDYNLDDLQPDGGAGSGTCVQTGP